MTVTLPSSGGFELEVGTQIGNAQAGTLAAGTNSTIATNGGLQFATSSTETTSFTFSWTPPATNVGNVEVWVTGGGLGTNYSNTYLMTPTATTPAPSITSFSATSSSITAGNSTMLTAIFSNGTGSIDNGVGTVTSGTAVTVKPTVTTTYTLTVSGTGTPATSKLTVTVTPAALPPSISSFTVGTPSITAGASTTLTAVFSNGTGSVSNGVGAVTSGTPVTIIPSATTTYTLTVTGTGTPATAQATITVNPPTGTGTLAVSPSSLSFNYQMGGSTPAAKTVGITSTGGSTSYTATAADPWLTITPMSGTGTPGSITASVNPSGMTAGTYGSQINVTSAGGNTATVTVSLIITSSSSGGGTTSSMYARPYVSDSTSGALASAWINNMGTTPNDPTDLHNRALVVSKGGTAPTNSWAGATIQNVTGMSLTEVGFDFLTAIPCNTGSIHFVITTTNSTTHTVGGCTSTVTTGQSTAPTGWTRVQFDPTQATPPMSPSDHVQSISLDLNQGSIAVIDNITINRTAVGKGSSTTYTPPSKRDE
jgi:hypothetical protein